jgi:hypothetical protein
LKREEGGKYLLSSPLLSQPNSLLLVDVRDVGLVRLLDDDLIESAAFCLI